MSSTRTETRLRTQQELKEAFKLFDRLSVERSALQLLKNIEQNNVRSHYMKALQIGDIDASYSPTRFINYASIAVPDDEELTTNLRNVLMDLARFNIIRISTELRDMGFNPEHTDS